MVHGYRIKPLQWQVAVLAAVLAAVLLVLPRPARAQGLFDFLFGGFQRPTPPANVNSYAPPSPGIDRVAPAPLGSESVRQDGRLPLQRLDAISVHRGCSPAMAAR